FVIGYRYFRIHLDVGEKLFKIRFQKCLDVFSAVYFCLDPSADAQKTAFFFFYRIRKLFYGYAFFSSYTVEELLQILTGINFYRHSSIPPLSRLFTDKEFVNGKVLHDTEYRGYQPVEG